MKELDMGGLWRIFGDQKSRNREKIRFSRKSEQKKVDLPAEEGLLVAKRVKNYFSLLTSGAGADGKEAGADGKFLNAGSERSGGASESLLQQRLQELNNKAVAAKASSVNVRVMVVVVFRLLKK